MSDAAAAVTARQQAEGVPPARFLTARRIQRAGYILLGLQLACFLVWSTILNRRYALTWDFATYNQPWFLIAHGNLDPYSTLSLIPFWQNDAEFMPWALAPLYWLARTDLLLPWLQDLSIVGAEAVAFSWLCELARRHCRERDAVWLTGLGLLLLIANPWTWWAVSFDVHEEALVLFFALYLAWDLSKGRRRAWVWVLPVLLGGAPSATYVVGIGIGGVLAGRRTRVTGAAIALVGVAYSLFLALVHGDMGVPLPRHYGYLATGGSSVPDNFSLADLATGIAAHPLGIIGALWGKRVDILANLAPGGLLGLCVPVVMPFVMVVLLANSLSPGFRFTEPLFQSLPIYVILPVGTVAVLAWLLRHRRRSTLVLAGLLAAQAVGWAAVWGPRTPLQWLRVSGPAAETLAAIQARIPASDEVIASQGVVGRFSSRSRVYGLSWLGSYPVHGVTWIVIAPAVGIETLSPAASMTLIGDLAGPLGASLVTHANGVWAFRWVPPPGTSLIVAPDGSSPLPAWAGAASAGRAVTTGGVSGWHMAATGGPGYVADGLEWRKPPGQYLATVTMSAARPVNVEVWDDTTNRLLARRTVTGTSGVDQVQLPVPAARAPDGTVYAGWGPFRADFALPPPGQLLEVRVWSPGGVAVNVYSAELTGVGPGRVAALP